PKKFVITYHDGEKSYTQEDVEFESKSTLKTLEFKNPGFTFLGWATVSGGEVVYENEEEIEYTSTSNIDLYAVWEASTTTPYLVTYYVQNNNGGFDLVQSNVTLRGTTNAQITKENLVVGFEDVVTFAGSKEGYEFYAIVDGVVSGEITSISTTIPTINGDIENNQTNLVVVFTLVKNIVSFNETMFSQPAFESVTLQYVEAGLTTAETETKTENVTTANYRFNIQYNSQITVTVVTNAGYALSDFTITDGTYDVTTLTPSSEVVDEDDKFTTYTLSTSMFNYTVRFEIEFENREYNIYYHFDDKEEPKSVQQVHYADTQVKLTETFTKTGYTLLGWSKSINGTVDFEEFDVIDLYDFVVDLHLYAVWQANAYNVTYILNGGSFNGNSFVQATELAEYDKVFKIEIATNDIKDSREGFKFVGWSDELNGDGDCTTVTDLSAVKNKGVYIYNGEYYIYNLVSGDVNNKTANVYVIWDAIRYYATITSKTNSGTQTINLTDPDTNDTKLSYGKDYYLPKVRELLGWENIGERFVGWQIKVNGTLYDFWTCGDTTEVLFNVPDIFFRMEAVKDVFTEGYTIEFVAKWFGGVTSYTISLYFEEQGLADDAVLLEENFKLGQFANGKNMQIKQVVVEGDPTDAVTLSVSDVFYGYINRVWLSDGSKHSVLTASEIQQIENAIFGFEVADIALNNVKYEIVGNTVDMKIYLSRAFFTLTVNVGEGINEIEIDKTELGSGITNQYLYSVKYGSEVELGASVWTGYKPAQIKINGLNVTSPITITGNTVVEVSAQPLDNVQYKINIHLQNANGIGETVKTIVAENGVTDAILSIGEVHNNIADAIATEGIDINGLLLISETITGTVVRGDGKTEVEVYYQRNNYNLTITSNFSSAFRGVVSLAELGAGIYRYGQEVEIRFSLRSGFGLDATSGSAFTFTQDEKTVTVDNALTGHYILKFNMLVGDTNLDIKIVGNTVNFYVDFFYQDVTLDGYTQDTTNYAELNATAGSKLSIDEILTLLAGISNTGSKTGFERLVGASTPEKNSDGTVFISGDGDTRVEIYFNRIQYIVSVTYTDEYHGLVDATFAVKANGVDATVRNANQWYVAFGQTVTVEVPVYAGFVFNGFKVGGANQNYNPKNADTTVMQTYIMDGVVVNGHLIGNAGITFEIETQQVTYSVEYKLQTLDSNGMATNQYQSLQILSGYTASAHEVIADSVLSEYSTLNYIRDHISANNFNIIKSGYVYSNRYDCENPAMVGSYIIRNGVSGDNSTVFVFYFDYITYETTFKFNSSEIIDVTVKGNYENNIQVVKDYEANETYVTISSITVGTTIEMTANEQPGYTILGWQVKMNGNVVKSQNGKVISLTFTQDMIDDNFEHVEIVILTRKDEINYTIVYKVETAKSDTNISGAPVEIYRRNATAEIGSSVSSSEFADAFFEGLAGVELNTNGYYFEYDDAPIYTIKAEFDENGNVVGTTEVEVYFALSYFEFSITADDGFTSVGAVGLYDEGDVEFVSESYVDEQLVRLFRARYTSYVSLVYETEMGKDFESWELTIGTETVTLTSSTFKFDTINDNIVISAKSMVKDIVITFYANNGTGRSLNQYVTYNVATRLDALSPLFTNNGRKFLGWALSPNGEVVYQDKAYIYIDFDERLELYAIWEEEGEGMWWLWLLIGLLILLIIIVIIILIIAKRRRHRNKMMSR
ncbi:MAG: InlB B-repeat-containing protein, partial [Clostridia bacterium]|nr:InlB B-repeat-containing protein [Clostridia bacterium]